MSENGYNFPEIKKGATWPPIDARLNLDIATGLTGCTVSFRMISQPDADGMSSILVDAAATIIDEATQHVRYQWQSGDTNTSGQYWSEFWVVTSDGKLTKQPADNYIGITILEDAS